jgi:hypothetical protein
MYLYNQQTMHINNLHKKSKITLINFKKKSKSRPNIALELHEYLESEFIFPQAELTKRGPHVVADETLNIKGSLLSKKLSSCL